MTKARLRMGMVRFSIGPVDRIIAERCRGIEPAAFPLAQRSGCDGPLLWIGA